VNAVVGDLFDRAERAGAALMICDGQDRILRANRKHAQIYNFIDFSTRPTFEEFVRGSVNSRKMADPFVYQDPQAWLNAAARSRQTCDYSQFITRHTDGRVMMVSYEKIKAAENGWYQARIDITDKLKARLKQDGVLLGPTCWEGMFAPLTRIRSVPITNVLEAMPAAAGLIMPRGKLLDANRALFALLCEGDGLLRVEDRVVVRDPSEQAEFQRRLGGFFQPGACRATVAMRISRQESQRPYFLTVSPLLDSGHETWNDGQIAVLTVANPSVAPAIDPAILAEFLGLTPAEAEVAAALGAGHTVVFIAQQRGASIHTIYSQIKKIIEKTGYKGQADIARHVSDIARIFGRQ
jgi:DNA-binding CsgD family transcriptional regulator